MQAFIYRSTKKPDSYLYIVRKDDFADIPEMLLKVLGKLALAGKKPESSPIPKL